LNPTTDINDIDDMAGEQSRAVYPDHTFMTERDGVRVHHEVYGSTNSGFGTVALLPTWSFVHSRSWKAQIGPLSRRYQVLVTDPRGNGRSDRPDGREHYADREIAEDVLDALDDLGVDRALLVANSRGTQRGLVLATDHAERVAGLAAICPYFLGTRAFAAQVRLATTTFDRRPLTTAGKLKFNGPYLEANHPDFVDWFTAQMLNEPHSTKQSDDTIGWAHETTGRIVAESWVADLATRPTRADQLELARRVSCPVLVIHGDNDRVVPPAEGRVFAETTGGTFVSVPHGTHLPGARKPAVVNRELQDFCARVLGPGAPVERPAALRRRAHKRVLFVSSPIGLGHARRDLAIARSLRQQGPDVRVEWLTQHPVTTMLEREGEELHPAHAALALESAHIESESAEHDLHCFHSHRRMDEILIHNFMVFQDVVDAGDYDLVVADEAWDIDYFTHEHPNLKRAPLAWLTDFVGFLPTVPGDRRESELTADYNAEMVGHIERHPTVRDRAIFVGNPDDVVADHFGPDLPAIRAWTEEHFDFAGYVTGFDPATLADRAALRAELGYGPDEHVCIVTVGGSGVGTTLLRRVIDAHPVARANDPALRTIVVAGPRIDPATLPTHPGLEVCAYVHDLYRHLAACDLAIVQGGLTTAMELTATGTPFVYVPLQHHFEQEFHVRHRLERYGAGRHLAFADADPDHIAEMINNEIGRRTDYRPVERDGADRAAAMIAELL